MIPPKPPVGDIEVNLLGVYRNAWLALYYMRLPSMAENTTTWSKSLILCSSVAGYSDMPTNTDYNASNCRLSLLTLTESRGLFPNPLPIFGRFAYYKVDLLPIKRIVGVRGIFRGLRHTTRSLNVRVNLIAPFWINTPLVHPNLPQMAAIGLRPGKGLAFAKSEDVVNVATKFATNESIRGGAFMVVPNGYFDMNENDAGEWTGDVLREQWRVRRAKGDVML